MEDCGTCNGTGRIEKEECSFCNGSGKVEPSKEASNFLSPNSDPVDGGLPETDGIQGDWGNWEGKSAGSGMEKREYTGHRGQPEEGYAEFKRKHDTELGRVGIGEWQRKYPGRSLPKGRYFTDYIHVPVDEDGNTIDPTEDRPIHIGTVETTPGIEEVDNPFGTGMHAVVTDGKAYVSRYPNGWFKQIQVTGRETPYRKWRSARKSAGSEMEKVHLTHEELHGRIAEESANGNDYHLLNDDNEYGGSFPSFTEARDAREGRDLEIVHSSDIPDHKQKSAIGGNMEKGRIELGQEHFNHEEQQRMKREAAKGNTWHVLESEGAGNHLFVEPVGSFPTYEEAATHAISYSGNGKRYSVAQHHLIFDTEKSADGGNMGKGYNVPREVQEAHDKGMRFHVMNRDGRHHSSHEDKNDAKQELLNIRDGLLGDDVQGWAVKPSSFYGLDQTSKGILDGDIEKKAGWNRQDGYRVHRDEDNKIHSVDGQPSVTKEKTGYKAWFNHGRRHRPENQGPAVINNDGSKEYWTNGMRHRKAGPAVIHADGSVEYHLNGQSYPSKEEWKDAVIELRSQGRGGDSDSFGMSAGSGMEKGYKLDPESKEYAEKAHRNGAKYHVLSRDAYSRGPWRHEEAHDTLANAKSVLIHYDDDSQKVKIVPDEELFPASGKSARGGMGKRGTGSLKDPDRGYSDGLRERREREARTADQQHNLKIEDSSYGVDLDKETPENQALARRWHAKETEGSAMLHEQRLRDTFESPEEYKQWRNAYNQRTFGDANHERAHGPLEEATEKSARGGNMRKKFNAMSPEFFGEDDKRVMQRANDRGASWHVVSIQVPSEGSGMFINHESSFRTAKEANEYADEGNKRKMGKIFSVTPHDDLFYDENEGGPAPDDDDDFEGAPAPDQDSFKFAMSGKSARGGFGKGRDVDDITPEDFQGGEQDAMYRNAKDGAPYHVIQQDPDGSVTYICSRDDADSAERMANRYNRKNRGVTESTPSFFAVHHADLFDGTNTGKSARGGFGKGNFLERLLERDSADYNRRGGNMLKRVGSNSGKKNLLQAEQYSREVTKAIITCSQHLAKAVQATSKSSDGSGTSHISEAHKFLTKAMTGMKTVHGSISKAIENAGWVGEITETPVSPEPGVYEVPPGQRLITQSEMTEGFVPSYDPTMPYGYNEQFRTGDPELAGMKRAGATGSMSKADIDELVKAKEEAAYAKGQLEAMSKSMANTPSGSPKARLFSMAKGAGQGHEEDLDTAMMKGVNLMGAGDDQSLAASAAAKMINNIVGNPQKFGKSVLDPAFRGKADRGAGALPMA